MKCDNVTGKTGMSPAFPVFSVVKRLLLIFSYGRVYAENTIITIH